MTFESKNERIARPGHQENPERKCFAKKKRKEKIEGILLEVLEKSTDEVDCLCEWAGKCGGCLYQTLPYEKQLAIKEAQIKKMLDNGGTDYTFEGIVSSPVVSGYRIR